MEPQLKLGTYLSSRWSWRSELSANRSLTVVPLFSRWSWTLFSRNSQCRGGCQGGGEEKRVWLATTTWWPVCFAVASGDVSGREASAENGNRRERVRGGRDWVDDNVESFLSNDGGDGGNVYGAVKQSPAEQQKESSKGFTFAEVSSIRSRNIKVTCCHFSSDGKWLASAGDVMKVVFWNMDTFKTENSPMYDNVESFLSNDGGDGGNVYGAVKQSPAEQQKESSKGFTFAEVSSIRSRNIKVTCCHFSSDGKWLASAGDVMKTELFCYCDGENEIRFWNINSSNCFRATKGVYSRVRFQPRLGHLPAARLETNKLFPVGLTNFPNHWNRPETDQKQTPPHAMSNLQPITLVVKIFLRA
ncbi:hypothetical protein DEO72_LG6g1978 [Vigna unguiculata]|uniref:Uncharacterized protein n=1 Tax=Vigna unguiculata TaxID=3917 RepID=A0A4D6MA45_VIGUN|nr:hypothetical protein DEO72_LG6g1978 [Vigna unguiculata]